MTVLLTGGKGANNSLEMMKEMQIRESMTPRGITMDPLPSLSESLQLNVFSKISYTLKTIITLFPRKLKILFHIIDIEIASINICMPAKEIKCLYAY